MAKTAALPAYESQVTVKQYNCLRCPHVWTPRGAKPRVCPKCKSPYWDRARRG